MRLIRLFATLAGACALALSACNTPSVPIPPPVIAALGFSDGPAGGQVLFTGKPNPRHANARFYALDLASGDGVITTAASDGSFTSPPFVAADGDSIRLAYDTPAGEHSDSVCVTLVRNMPLISHNCP